MQKMSFIIILITVWSMNFFYDLYGNKNLHEIHYTYLQLKRRNFWSIDDNPGPHL